jgi:hypothetical protein
MMGIHMNGWLMGVHMNGSMMGIHKNGFLIDIFMNDCLKSPLPLKLILDSFGPKFLRP